MVARTRTAILPQCSQTRTISWTIPPSMGMIRPVSLRALLAMRSDQIVRGGGGPSRRALLTKLDDRARVNRHAVTREKRLRVAFIRQHRKLTWYWVKVVSRDDAGKMRVHVLCKGAFAPAGVLLRIYSLFWMSVMAAVARIPKTASPGIPFLMHMRYLTGANGISE